MTVSNEAMVYVVLGKYGHLRGRFVKGSITDSLLRYTVFGNHHQLCFGIL